MFRPGQILAVCTLGLIGGFSGVIPEGMAAETTEVKGAKIYCFMRSSGNDHSVSWNASYAVIKRQGNGMFKTSPEHASVMITEAVVKDPGNFPDCGQYLGDLFGAGSRSSSTQGYKTMAPNAKAINGFDDQDDARYSY